MGIFDVPKPVEEMQRLGLARRKSAAESTTEKNGEKNGSPVWRWVGLTLVYSAVETVAAVFREGKSAAIAHDGLLAQNNGEEPTAEQLMAIQQVDNGSVFGEPSAGPGRHFGL